MSALYRVYVAQEIHYQADIEANSKEEAEEIAFIGDSVAWTETGICGSWDIIETREVKQ